MGTPSTPVWLLALECTASWYAPGIVRELLATRLSALQCHDWNSSYLPMQKVLKIRFRMSSVVVAPVIASRERRALYKSLNSISCGTLAVTASVPARIAESESLTT